MLASKKIVFPFPGSSAPEVISSDVQWRPLFPFFSEWFESLLLDALEVNNPGHLAYTQGLIVMKSREAHTSLSPFRSRASEEFSGKRFARRPPLLAFNRYDTLMVPKWFWFVHSRHFDTSLLRVRFPGRFL